MSAHRIPRWLRGGAWASPSGSSVRINLENNSGTRAEVYLTKTQARDLHHSLTYILRPLPLPEQQAEDVPS